MSYSMQAEAMIEVFHPNNKSNRGFVDFFTLTSSWPHHRPLTYKEATIYRYFQNLEAMAILACITVDKEIVEGLKIRVYLI